MVILGFSFVGDSEGDVSLILKMVFTTFYCLFGEISAQYLAKTIYILPKSILEELLFHYSFTPRTGLALIAMGISLMQESIQQKAGWFSENTENELVDMDRYILTKSYNVKETDPAHNGNRKNR